MKLMLIEDRLSRMEKYQHSDIKENSLVDIITGKDFDALLNSLKLHETGKLKNYGCIAAHRTALPDVIRESLKEFCEKYRKPLIFFSGGISSSVFKEIPFSFLNINSKDFYSANFDLFIEDMNVSKLPNLLILQFGIKWKLSLLLKLRNTISLYVSRKIMIIENIDALNNQTIVNRFKMVRDLQLSDNIINDLISDNEGLEFLKNPYYAFTEVDIKTLKKTVDSLIYENT